MAFVSAYNLLVTEKKEIIASVEIIRRTLCVTDDLQEGKRKLEEGTLRWTGSAVRCSDGRHLRRGSAERTAGELHGTRLLSGVFTSKVKKTCEAWECRPDSWNWVYRKKAMGNTYPDRQDKIFEKVV